MGHNNKKGLWRINNTNAIQDYYYYLKFWLIILVFVGIKLIMIVKLRGREKEREREKERYINIKSSEWIKINCCWFYVVHVGLCFQVEFCKLSL